MVEICPEEAALEWLLFCSEAGTPVDGSSFAFHFTWHCLTHTFALLLLQENESPQYVQRQLDQWFPMGNQTVVNRLDGSKSVANPVAGGGTLAEESGAGGGS